MIKTKKAKKKRARRTNDLVELGRALDFMLAEHDSFIGTTRVKFTYQLQQLYNSY